MEKKKKGQKLLATCLLKFLKAVTQHFNHIFLFKTWPFLAARQVGTFYSLFWAAMRPPKNSTTIGEWRMNIRKQLAVSVTLCS